MSDINDYIGIITSAPLASILLAYMYFNDRQKTKSAERTNLLFKDLIEKVTRSLDEAIKIIKQQERKP